MANKKRQHYVPQFLLKNFSGDQRFVQAYVFKSDKFVTRASIRDQCYQDYYYGHDSVVEDAFSELEGKVASVLASLSSNNLDSLSADDLTQLRLFIHYQYCRTMHAADDANKMFEGVAKRLIKHLPNFKTVDVDKYKFELTYPQNSNLIAAIQTTPIMSDLKIKLLVNDNKEQLIISDHPIVFYNLFAENHPKFKNHPASTGMASKGLIIFMPFCPEKCLMLYDQNTYLVGDCGVNGIPLSKNEVSLLNKLQMINLFECAYFMDSGRIGLDVNSDRASIQKIRDELNPEISEGEYVVGTDATPKSLITMYGKDIRIGATFSFLKISDHNGYENYDKLVLPIRSNEIDELTRRYSEYIEDKMKKNTNLMNKDDT